MEKIRKYLVPFGWLYGAVMQLRNFLFDKQILKSSKINIPIVSVGNLSVGGTGKTPHVEWIVEHLRTTKKVAILLRGYGRQTKGYLLVSKHCSSETVGDEALQYKKRFGNAEGDNKANAVAVAVCEKRVEGAKKLLEQFPDLEVIVLDDAFQHRKIKRDINILLIDTNRPYWEDNMLPAGNLREFPKGRNRADVILFTKASNELLEDSEKKNDFIQKARTRKVQLIGFTSIKYGQIIGFDTSNFPLPDKILLVTGIANADLFRKHVESFASVHHLAFPDHYDYTTRDMLEIHELFDTFAEENKVILTTEKDFMRLSNPSILKETRNYPWFYQKITIEMDCEQEFIEKLNEL